MTELASNLGSGDHKTVYDTILDSGGATIYLVGSDCAFRRPEVRKSEKSKTVVSDTRGIGFYGGR